MATYSNNTTSAFAPSAFAWYGNTSIAAINSGDVAFITTPVDQWAKVRIKISNLNATSVPVEIKLNAVIAWVTTVLASSNSEDIEILVQPGQTVALRKPATASPIVFYWNSHRYVTTP